ncbi:hypothetical protein [Steroidobacter cummioxidans]|uniref:hypothetical protein n=1 Tax=Steroidobacter cummioxidans TaxID=1803913 RepID=UPI0012903D25|nr:hypothetical protein [Steroidobacter cummioxidans]
MSCKVLMAAAIGALSGMGLLAHGDEALPEHLRDTGLFVAGSNSEVRPDVLPFSPQYPLWSDGASKRRWIYLPPGTFIDASRPGAWEFPNGTRLWKEFRLERRVETRLIERLADGSWQYATYVWSEDGKDAVLASREGAPSLALSGPQPRTYAIPSESDCRACHEGPAVPVLGFSALQLSSDRDSLAVHAESPSSNEVDLRQLVERGLVRNLPVSLFKTPPRISAASPTERAALGYLHGNCGHCHTNPGASDASVPLDLRLAQDVADPASTEKVLRSLRAASSQFRAPGTTTAVPLVAPGASHDSALLMRMRARDASAQMPPLGTAIPDSEGLALIARWIDRDMHPSTARE